MKNTVVLFISVSFSLLSTSLYSQQVRVGRQSLNSLGSSTVSNGIRISHTAGQASSTSVSKSGSLVIRQGFQQANLQYEVEKTDFEIQLFPNPNDGYFNVSATGIIGDDPISYYIVDLNGKKIIDTQKVDSHAFSVSILGVQPGMYYIIMNTISGKTASIKFTIQ